MKKHTNFLVLALIAMTAMIFPSCATPYGGYGQRSAYSRPAYCSRSAYYSVHTNYLSTPIKYNRPWYVPR